MTPAHSNTSLFVGFSGPSDAKNLAYWWKKLGGKRSDQFDKVNNSAHDILRNNCFAKLMRAFEKGVYDVAFFSPPCHTFSICRFRHMSNHPVLRTIYDIMGTLQRGDYLLAVCAVNTLIERMCQLIMVLHNLGKDWAVENPVQRSDSTGMWKTYFSAKFRLHGSLWQMPCIVDLIRDTGAQVVNLPMCFFDADGPQKYTSVLISKSLAPAASAFQRARCCHDKHKEVAVGLEHSRASQVYPSAFCEAWARVMRWPDDSKACTAVLSHLALSADTGAQDDAPVISTFGVLEPQINPLTYKVWVEALQRHRDGRPDTYDEVTFSFSVSQGVVTPGGICRPDSRGILHLPAP